MDESVVEQVRENRERATKNMLMYVNADRDLLAALLWEPAAVDDVWGIVTAESFYLPWHGGVFEAIRGVVRKGLRSGDDPIFMLRQTLGEEFWASVDMPSLLAELCERVPRRAQIADLARRVASLSARRAIQSRCAEIACLADPSAGIDDEELEGTIDELSDDMCASLAGRSYLYEVREDGASAGEGEER